MANIKKNDTVKVIAGKDKGKSGKVLKVLVKDEKVVVEGVNVYKKHQKQTATKEAGIVEKSMPIHISNVVALNPKTKEPTSFRMKTLEDGTRVRVCKKTGETID
ncbi:MAG TPA: 50S ribosomal protein L24 [bacterium]|jgi:large subunit ribosomal protein L24|nr:50S ribosomal protein L24 [bacterium]MDX9805549.1 50S ribosomal protein L24 [bacterium]HNW15781.1 50S ribosomal protein L24 [bacterium]HNZ53398.1 50S ribosomal protein L24 [bacterium]HOB70533.1 50S ribosomal protein L24 [bacterium]